MNAGDFMQVKLTWDIPSGSNPAINIYNFECLTATNPSSLQVIGDDIADAFIARYVTPLLQFQGVYTSLVGLELRKFADDTEMYTRSGVIATGTGNANVLPPFVTFNIQEHRFSAATRNGRIALPGIAINTGEGNGLVAPTVVASANTILAAWAATEFTVEGPDYVFQHGIARLTDGLNVEPTVFVPIRQYTLARKYGSQNTRK